MSVCVCCSIAGYERRPCFTDNVHCSLTSSHLRQLHTAATIFHIITDCLHLYIRLINMLFYASVSLKMLPEALCFWVVHCFCVSACVSRWRHSPNSCKPGEFFFVENNSVSENHWESLLDCIISSWMHVQFLVLIHWAVRYFNICQSRVVDLQTSAIVWFSRFCFIYDMN